MLPLCSTTISTEMGDKNISVFSCDVLEFDEPIDIFITSAFKNSYAPTPQTIFETLEKINIHVGLLANDPELDLRKLCDVWLSKEIEEKNTHIARIGCLEFIDYSLLFKESAELEQKVINSIKSFFRMLDIASIYNVKMDTVALPLLGSGRQNIDEKIIMIPILNECISFLKRNCSVKRIYFIERNPAKAQLVCQTLKNSYKLIAQDFLPNESELSSSKQKKMAFISYSSKDKNIADNLCAKLESKGIKVWYAPRNVHGPYAEAIACAIENSNYFVVILSKNSLTSEHVLNEIDLAFQRLPSKIKFKPLRIDESNFSPSFKYYLSRQHWMDAIEPPLEVHLNKFVEEILSD